jgi:hypothetical protein
MMECIDQQSGVDLVQNLVVGQVVRIQYGQGCSLVNDSLVNISV